MEEESKIPFFKKWKLSIFNLEEYQKLAVQKIRSTIGYLVILMLIFAFFSAASVTFKFHQTLQNIANYIDTNIDTINFKDGELLVKAKNNPDEPIVIDENQNFNGKIVINTKDISQDEINNYEQELNEYYNGIIILKDRVIIKTEVTQNLTTISLKDISEPVHLVNVEKEDVLSLISGNAKYRLYAVFFIAWYIALFINNFALVLLDVLLYSLIGYFVGIFTRIRLKYSAVYNIAAYSLTLPIMLNLVYTVINILTGYTITYFSVMYMAITCIYIFTAILLIKSDIIKKQIELSKIIQEQERIKQELEQKEQQKKEEEEREKVRKKDEKKRKEEKQNKDENEKDKQNGGPEPQANIKPTN